MKKIKAKYFMERKLTPKEHRRIEDDLFIRKYPETCKDNNDLPLKFDIYSSLKDVAIVKDDGTLLCVVLRKYFSKEASYNYFKYNADLVKPIDANRGNITGQKESSISYLDGTISKNKKYGRAATTITGYFDRAGRHNFCRKTANAMKDELGFHYASVFAKEADNALKEYAPLRYKNQKSLAEKTSKDFIIPDTSFTTITMNTNFRTAGHRDAGDLPEGFGVMSYLQSGKIMGGEFCFPAFKTGVRLYNRDCIIFDPHEIHCNKAITKASEKAKRMTAVFYYRKGMMFCGSHEQELDRARRNKGDQMIGPRSENLNPKNAKNYYDENIKGKFNEIRYTDT